MVLKRLKLHQFFHGVARTFSYTQEWVSEGGHEFKNFRKNVVFLVSSGKNKLSPLLPPPTLEKRLEKNTSGPPLDKILPMPMHASMQNYILFVKVVLHYTIYRQG